MARIPTAALTNIPIRRTMMSTTMPYPRRASVDLEGVGTRGRPSLGSAPTCSATEVCDGTIDDLGCAVLVDPERVHAESVDLLVDHGRHVRKDRILSKGLCAVVLLAEYEGSLPREFGEVLVVRPHEIGTFTPLGVPFHRRILNGETQGLQQLGLGRSRSGDRITPPWPVDGDDVHLPIGNFDRCCRVGNVGVEVRDGFLCLLLQAECAREFEGKLLPGLPPVIDDDRRRDLTELINIVS